MKIGVTGAQGFIGSHLIQHLSKNHDVVAYSSRESNYSNKKIKWIIKDLNSSTSSDFSGLDKLIHLAGTSLRENTLEKNYNLTKHILQSAIDAGVKQFYFASSYAVYGDRKEPASIDSNLNPLDDYAKSKASAEEVLLNATKDNKIEGIILRFCSVYGSGGKGIIDIIKKKIVNKEKIEIRDNFTNQYVFVDDLCRELCSIVESKKPSFVYNIEGETITGSKLSQILNEMNVEHSFSDVKTRSYLSKGTLVKRTVDVKTYLKDL